MPKITTRSFILGTLILVLGLTSLSSLALADSNNYSLSIQGSSSVPGNSQSQYTAYFRGSKVNASWSLSSTQYAAISSSGLLTTKTVTSNHSVTVRASYNGYHAYKSVTITASGTTVSLTGLTLSGPSSVNSGATASYTATATFSNGTTQNVSGSATWSLNPGVGSISGGTYSPGNVTSNQTVTISASYTSGGVTKSANTTVTVVAQTSTKTLSSIAVTGPSSVNSGSTANYTATATFSDNSTQNVTTSATWSVGPAVGTISGGTYSPGNVTSNQTVTITASYTAGGVTRSGNTTVSVVASPSNATLSSIAVSGPSSVTSGTSGSYTATATFSNNTTQNVTSSASWSVNPAVGTISAGNYSPGTVSVSQTVSIGASYTYGGVTKSASVSITVNPATAGNGSYQVFAYNDLGMHCYDADFSIFGVLPLYNVVRGQVVLKGTTPQLMNSGSANLTYQAIADGKGSINSTSPLTKTNFWTYVQQLFGVALPVDTGIKGQKMPGTSNTPQPFSSPYDTNMNSFGAEGIPITCIDDAGKFNAEPLMRISAKNSSGTVLSNLDVVVPASNEMNCSNCHVTGGVGANTATATKYGVTQAWSTNATPGIQTKENILILHDAANKTSLMANKPVLCASCHYSAALDLNHTGPTGAQVGPKYLSRAMHQHHGLTVNGTVPDANNPAIVVSNGTSACYQCHPGAQTQCLRGVMATAGMTCENCHGDMLAVGGYYNLKTTGAPRNPWLDEPKCQSCHTGDAVSHQGTSLIGAQAYSSTDAAATPIVATNTRFAETNATTLYRFSTGHGGLACESCHGSTHAEWPAKAGSNDNIAATEIQGHSGEISECTACHGTGLSRTMSGPHGMHNVNDSSWWNGGHEGFLGTNGANCKTCHGTDGLGTTLSKAKANRTFGSRTITAGTPVACNMCHSNYINGGG